MKLFQTLLLASPAAYCNKLQDATTHCNTLQYAHFKLFETMLLAGPAAHSFTLQRAATPLNKTAKQRLSSHAHAATRFKSLRHAVTHCNMLLRTATHYDTIYTIAHPIECTRCNTLQHDATRRSVLQHAAPCSLKHTARHCNSLQHGTSTRMPCHTHSPALCCFGGFALLLGALYRRITILTYKRDPPNSQTLN